LEYDDVLNKHREVIYKKRVDIIEGAPTGKLKEEILGFVEKFGYTKDDYEKKEKEIGTADMRGVEKVFALRILDMLWTEHLENMESLRDSVNLRAYGQRDPLIEYKKESHILFDGLLANFESLLVNNLLKANVQAQNQTQTENQAMVEERKSKDDAVPEIGRNDPCPCGSGKKYKKCHGASK
jgi:preprotein translocase subunit SecA